ncbi:hypothetical protein ONE63_009303 [Megalurothrips usitatus]|uniref:FBA domain-containing protein n=1 Tax=Megalurothrips usitatus TaxID=439358 RepID=A0AAV7XMK6_9NEOP|nr:hypothetical protein ONE63_009303 [Megalurothrips usitatus]
MGSIYTKQERSDSDDSDRSEIPENNGLIFNECFFPPEVVMHILTFLDPISRRKDPPVLRGRLVCRAWRDMIDSPSFWRIKVLREVPGATHRVFHNELMWSDYYHLCAKKPHKKNLVKNGSAEDDLKHWSAGNAIYGGSRWKVENQPIGCDAFPAGTRKCFVTSFEWCSAEQIINLRHFGLTPNFMKHVKPFIYIEEWHTGRFDCGFEYSLNVTLLSNSWDIVDTFVYNTLGHSTEWKKVRHCFSNYDKEVAAIVFTHKGKDTQFWAGHYGSKITGARVYVTFPGCEEIEDPLPATTAAGGRQPQ